MGDETVGTVMKGNYTEGRTDDQDKKDDYSGTLIGGSGDDTIFAGAGDKINAGDGNNMINLSPEEARGDADEGATVSITAEGSNNTISGFNFGADDDSDVLDATDLLVADVSADGDDVVVSLQGGGTLVLEDAIGETTQFDNSAIENGPLPVQFGDKELVVDDEARYYWAVGDEPATVTIGDVSADSLVANLGNADFNDQSQIGFYGDIAVLDASTYEGESTLKGNDDANVIKASKDGSDIDGGAGDDTLVGGNGADTFNVTAEGDKLLQSFTTGTDEDSDRLNTGELAITGADIDDNGNVVLTTEDGSITLEDADNKIVQFNNDFIEGDEPLAVAFGNELKVTDDATFYWGTGSEATVSLADYEGDEINVDLSNPNFNDRTQPGFYGDIKEVDASGYEGAATITGNDGANVLKASNGGATLDGGADNDTLVGGDGADDFIVGQGGADADAINSGNEIVTGVEVDKDGNVIISLENGNSVTVEDAGDKIVQFKNDAIEGDKPLAVAFGDSLSVTDNATFYWATDSEATVSLADYDKDMAVINLDNADFNDTSVLGFYGDIKEVDASEYAGYAMINGNSDSNVIKAGEGGSFISGGEGENTLVAGAGADVFVVGEGDDVIQGFDAESDAIVAEAAVDAVSISGDDVIMTVKASSLLMNTPMATKLLLKLLKA